MLTRDPGSDKLCGELTRDDIEFAIARCAIQRPAVLLEFDPRFRPEMLEDRVAAEILRATETLLAKAPTRPRLTLDFIRDHHKRLFDLVKPSQLHGAYLADEHYVVDEHAAYWSQVIVQVWACDQLAETAEFLIAHARANRSRATAADAGLILLEHQQQLEQIENVLNQSREPLDVPEQLPVIRSEVYDGKVVRKVKTGIRDLDDLAGGLPSGQVSTIAARPGVGKTAIGLQILQHAWDHGANALFFSIEQPWRDVDRRLLCQVSQATFGDIDRPDWWDSKEGQEAVQRVCQYRAKVIDKVDMTARDIASSIAIFHSSEPVDLVLVDYLQLIPSINTRIDRHLQIRQSIEALNSIAKRLDVPILLLAQLNRKAEDMKGNPTLAWLGESASIEQASNQVMFLIPGEDEGRIRETTLWVMKNRHGATGSVRLAFRGEQFKFTGWAAENTNTIELGGF